MTADSSTYRPLAAFDFDGTITRRDTLYPFLRALVGRRRLVTAALADLPRLGAAAVGRGDRDEAKARLFERLLAGREASEVRQLGLEHARRVVAVGIRPEMRRRIAWHCERGHEVAIVSASLDVYLDEIGRELGVDHVICTTLEVRDGLLTGVMVGGNCRGDNKVHRLRAAFADLDDRELWAYGDSAGDDAMLAIADHPTRV
jgi:HAD superfamily hydrolase (TIGR01490 family)